MRSSGATFRQHHPPCQAPWTRTKTSTYDPQTGLSNAEHQRPQNPKFSVCVSEASSALEKGLTQVADGLPNLVVIGQIGGSRGEPLVTDYPFFIHDENSPIGGNVALQSKLLAVQEINAAGGINGRTLKLIIEDSKCNARDSITAYTKLTSVDGVKIILGTSCSGAMLGAAPLAEKDGTIMFSGLATNPLIADAGDYIFRTAINDKLVGVDTGNTIWSDGVRKLGTITEATDYAEGVRRETAKQFESLGGDIVASEAYASEETDYRAAITRILGKDPDGIHIAAQAEFAGGTIVKQLRELGWDGPIYGEIVVIGATALDVAGEAATGVKGIVPALDPGNTKATEFLDRFRERYDYTTLEWYMGSAYDDVFITAACLAQTGDDQDAAGFRDCLYNMSSFEGTIGTYTFDSDGEVVGLSNAVAEVLPVAERTSTNAGWKILGPAPILP